MKSQVKNSFESVAPLCSASQFQFRPFVWSLFLEKRKLGENSTFEVNSLSLFTRPSIEFCISAILFLILDFFFSTRYT